MLKRDCVDALDVDAISLGAVAVDFEDFGDESLPWPMIQLDKEIQRIGDIALDGAIGEFDPALQNAAREAR